MRARFGSRGVDAAIAALAARQHGAVSRAQLLALGLSSASIQRRVRAGRLHVVFLGVYAVGHRKLSREGRWMAAVLAGGEGALLSDDSAAVLHGFVADERGGPHITTRGGRKRAGIHIHRRELAPDEVTAKHGIPVTTAARTLLDLAATSNPLRLERTLREALFQRATSLPALRRLLGAHPGHRGARALHIAIENAEDAPGRIASNSEHRFLVWLRNHDLPLPELNVPMQVGELTLVADFLWRDPRVIAEIDHRGTHARRRDFESDRRRDRALQVARWRPIRITEPFDDSLYRDLSALLVVAVRAA